MASTSDNSVVQASAGTLPQVCGGAALAILLVMFVGLSPFTDLGDSRLLDQSGGNETFTYIALFVLVSVAGLLLLWLGRLPLKPLATRWNLLLLAWLCVSVVLSADPGTSARRLALALMTFALAAMLPWLTQSLRHFTNLTIIAVVTALLLCYVGVLLEPQLTVHQSTDLVDPEIADDWRGIYGHKNLAASMMSIFVFVGAFVARMGRPATGIVIAVAAFIFLLLTGGKSAIGMIFVAAAAAFAVARSRTLPMKAFFAFGPLALLAALTVGSVASETIRSLVSALPIDSTFTGRTEIWNFALEAIGLHPWKGHGFEAFWYSSAVRYGAEDSTRWMVEVATSHNSYIDLALTIGVPGLMLVLIAFLAAPLVDYHRTRPTPANQDLAQFLLVLWLFALYFGTFEALFLSRANPVWFVLAFALCGLRYTAEFDTRA